MARVRLPLPVLMIKIELTQRKLYPGGMWQKGAILDGQMQRDGSVRLVRKPMVVIEPDEYRLYIPDHAYDRLLEDMRR